MGYGGKRRELLVAVTQEILVSHAPETEWVWFKEGEMLRVNDWWFYNLGRNVHALVEIKEGATVGDVFWRLYGADNWLAAFLDGNEIFPFKVSLQAARALRSHVQTFLGPNPEWGRAINAYEASEFERLTSQFETIASAEVSQFSTYSVVKKLAYDTRTLLEEGESILPTDIRLKLPPESIEDIREAAKCMAFEVNTASGFHTIRATEAVIRMYYQEVVGSAPKIKDRNWGAYIKVLRAKGADPRVIGFLDHIRESYRNPISHPDQRLDAQEAQVLLGVCVSAIIQMVLAVDALRALAIAQLPVEIPPALLPVVP